MAVRPQPYRIKWPLTPAQVYEIDEMLGILFQQANQTAVSLTAVETASSVPGADGLMGLQGLDGDEGEMGVPGPQGIPGPQGPQGYTIVGDPGEDGEMGWPGPAGSSSGSSGPVSRVTLTGETTTIENRKSLAVIDYYAVEGTGVLVLQGDAALGVL